MKLRVKIKAAGLGTNFFELFFSKTGDFLIGLLEFSLKILNKGQKVIQLAFIWPFWPWKAFHFKGF